MYYSKQNGGNTFAFYSPEMNAAAVERLMLKSKLRARWSATSSSCATSPRSTCAAAASSAPRRCCAGACPGHGDIPPSQFIPLAEETNLILEIGEWVLNRVCIDYRACSTRPAMPGAHRAQPVAEAAAPGELHPRCRSVFARHASRRRRSSSRSPRPR
jgi:predicted signal transduction protein with EAL and GGDEF domain